MVPHSSHTSFEYLSGLEELLLDQTGYLFDKVLLALVLILLKKTLEGVELLMSNERRHLDL